MRRQAERWGAELYQEDVEAIDVKRLDKVNTMEYECFNNAEIHSLLSELLIFEDVNVFSKQFLKLLDITYWITFAYFDFFSLFIILDVSCCLGCWSMAMLM